MAIAAIALTSCKKDEPATSELGEATITGNVWADLDQTNDTQNGVYIQNLNPEGVVGMQVSVEINTQNLAQNPIGGYDYEVRTYTATTDAAGNYTLVLPATDDAFSVTLQFQDIYTTRTVLGEDGVTGISENVKVTLGNQSATIYSGATIAKQNEASVSVTNVSAMEYGTATLFGNVYANWYAGMNPPANGCGGEDLCNAASPFAGKSIMWAYYDGPHGESEDIWYSTPIAADGSYSMTITTEEAGGSTVGIYWGISDFIGDRTRMNAAFTADSTCSAVYTTYGLDNYSTGGFYSGELRQFDICGGYIGVTEL